MKSININKFYIEENINKLSARYDSHYSPLMMKNQFIDEYQKIDGIKLKPSSRSIVVDGKEAFAEEYQTNVKFFDKA